MDSRGDAHRYLTQVDGRLADHDMNLSGIQIGQTALWEYAHAAGVEIDERETDDVDIYTPDFEAVFDLAGIYNAAPRVSGARIEVSTAPREYMDLLVDHGITDELYDAFESGAPQVNHSYDRLNVDVAPIQLFIKDKLEAETAANRGDKDAQDLDTLAGILQERPDLIETFDGEYRIDDPAVEQYLVENAPSSLEYIQ